MCLAVPGKILEKFTANGLPMGLIDFAGVQSSTCLSCTPEAVVGDYVLVHAGFALQVLREDEAMASLRELSRLAGLMADDGSIAADPRETS